MQFTNVGASLKFKGKTKVFKFKPHELHFPHSEFIVGFAGTAQDIITVADYFECPEEYKQLPKVRNLAGLVLTATKDIFTFDSYDKWLKVEQDYWAIGSGAQVALGVMAAGGSPKDAIKAAMKHDAFTGMGIKALKF